MGKISNLRKKVNSKTLSKILSGFLATSVAGSLFLYHFGKNSKAVKDGKLTSINGSLYLVDVINEEDDIQISDVNGQKIDYDFNDNVLAIVGAKNGKTSDNKMYEVVLADNDNNLTYGIMDGKFLSNEVIDSVDVLNNDFYNCTASYDCGMYASASTTDSLCNIDIDQDLIVSDKAFLSPYNDYSWNEAIFLNNNELFYGYLLNNSLATDFKINDSFTYYVIPNSLNVRSDSTINSDILCKLNKNSEITMCNDFAPYEDGNYKWVYIKYKDSNGELKKGWVAEIDYTSGTPKKLISNEKSSLTDEISSEFAVLYDATDDKVLFDKNANEQWYPASITKILTAYIVSLYGNLDDKIVYSENAVNVEGHAFEQYGTTSSSPVFDVVKVGNSISVRDALNISLLLSDNATTVALKEYVESITGADFEDLMNKTAKKLGCKNSYFTNSYGYGTDIGVYDEHVVTAYDMALIASGIVRDAPDILNIMNTSSYKLECNGSIIEHQSVFVNKDACANNPYYNEYALGSKTGWTTKSGQTMVTIFEKDDHVYVVVTLNGAYIDTKNIDTKILADYAFSLTEDNKSLKKTLF